MSYEPHHFTCDPDGRHAATRAAHQEIRRLDQAIADYVGDHAGLLDLKRLQGDLVARHGQPPAAT
jgi:hypothetical protein